MATARNAGGRRAALASSRRREAGRSSCSIRPGRWSRSAGSRRRRLPPGLVIACRQRQNGSGRRGARPGGSSRGVTRISRLHGRTSHRTGSRMWDHPTPVGIYPTGATPDGSCDMAGNVREWCQDGKREYTAAAVRNPVGPSEAGLRVIRGGGWRDRAGVCRAASRYGFEPQDRVDCLGLRLAAVPQAKSSPGRVPSQAEPGAQAEPAHAERSGAEPDRAEADTPG